MTFDRVIFIMYFFRQFFVRLLFAKNKNPRNSEKASKLRGFSLV